MHRHGEGMSVMLLSPQWPVRLVYNHVDGSVGGGAVRLSRLLGDVD